MDKPTAQQLIEKTFQNSFDKERFHGFIKNLLNHIEETPNTVYLGNLIPDAYEPYIKKLKRIGRYKGDPENKIDVLVVYLKKESSLEHARTMQRNFIAWYLNGSRGGELKDAALVAFVAPDVEDWRFSLVKMEYKITETVSGRVKVKEEFTPARRYSFLVGKNETSHTAKSRLVPILSDDRQNPTLKELEEAFNIEKVTKEFFKEYRGLFLWTKETLDDVVKEEHKVKADFEAKGVNTVNFAKKLLGQVIFLYFLQKKGWFGVARDAAWGTGPKNFLRELFKGKHDEYKNFFNDILEPLFYEALARERDNNFYSRFNCKIPFLNGGLFDPINNYDWVHTDILLPNKLFSNDDKTKEGDTGNGILDIFDRYNFTVKEDEPLEKEVAIDPEMLGKVFENLLEVKDRKSKGTYYTPREIVHYMCRESLVNYLYSELNPGSASHAEIEQKKLFGGSDPKQLKLLGSRKELIPREDIETLIKYGETVVEHENRVVNAGKETSTYSFKLPESIRGNAKLIDEKLASIRICDPAVGSGAFLVGMMTEIIRTRNALTPYLPSRHSERSEESRTIYDSKRHAIQNCLYGVDIDPGAVEIAKLRLWLSLVVDEEDIKQIKPLPNLDYKIVCGNSLLGVEKNLFNANLFSRLEELKPLYFNETSASKKQEYKKQIDELISQITNGHKEFDFEVYFSEAFHEKKGFDVVIANPPYVFGGTKQISRMEKKQYKQMYFSGSKKINLFSLFTEMGTTILKPQGLLVYIVPNTLLRVTSYANIREFIVKNATVSEIVDLDIGVFEKVTASTIIISLYRKMSDGKNLIQIKCGIKKVVNVIEQSCFDQPLNYIFDIFASSKDRKLIQKLCRGTDSLGSITKYIRFGVVISENINEVVDAKKHSENWKPFLEGDEIGEYYIQWKGRFLHYDPSSLHRSRTPDVFETHKIIVQRITGGTKPLKATLDCDNYYTKESLINIVLSEDCEYEYGYVLALVNSSLMSWFYKTKYTNESKLTVNLSKEYLSEIPIKKASVKDQKQFIELVNKILAITKDDDYLEDPTKQAKVREYEKQIDQMVYKLYGLPPEEIEIVEGRRQ